jgi:hypothetical protein
VTLTSTSASAYSWVHGSTKKSTTVSSAGVYRVTVTGTNGCKSTSADKIITSSSCTPPPVPTISSSRPNNVIEEGSSLTLTASDAGGWLWSNGATTRSITVTTAGTYTVRAYKAGYCFATSKPVSVYMINSGARLFEEIFESPESSPVPVTLYPNPAYEDFKVSFSAGKEEKCEINVYDLSGRILLSQEINALEGPNTIEMKTGTLPPAMYVLVVSGQLTFGMVRFNVVQ